MDFKTKMPKIYRCFSCTKKFKNSSSLASHRYRYHPYLSKRLKADSDVSSIISDVSSVSSLGSDYKHGATRYEGKEDLFTDIIDLKRKLNFLESKEKLQKIDIESLSTKVNNLQKNDLSRDILKNSNEINTLKNEQEENIKRIKMLEVANNYQTSESDSQDSESQKSVNQDLDNTFGATDLEEMMSIRDMIMNGIFDVTDKNIESLNRVIGLIQTGVIEIDTEDDLSQEDGLLLDNIQRSEMEEAKSLVYKNMKQIQNIFKVLAISIKKAYIKYMDEIKEKELDDKIEAENEESEIEVSDNDETDNNSDD